MSDVKGAPSTAPSTPARFPSQPQKSPADRATFAAASHVSASGLSRKGRAALARLESALAPAPLPTETASRRRVMNVRGW